MNQPHRSAAVNPLPPIIVALAVPMALLEAALWLGSRGLFDGLGWRITVLQDLALYPQLLQAMADAGRWPASELMRFVTFPFVHYAPLHAIMAIVFLLALGKMVGEVFNAFAVLVVFFGSAVFGAIAYALLATSNIPLAGGFPAVYGLIGAFTYLLYVQLGALGAPQARAFTLIGFLLGIQLVFGLLFGAGQDWIAEVAGFVAGFALSVVVSPGGFRRLRARIQRR